jgi:hypothetical protein
MLAFPRGAGLCALTVKVLIKLKLGHVELSQKLVIVNLESAIASLRVSKHKIVLSSYPCFIR